MSEVKKCRRRPQAAEALQVTRHNYAEIEKFTNCKVTNVSTQRHPGGKCYITVETPSGFHITLAENDFLIMTEHGTVSVRDKRKFKEEYEVVEE